jgi:hypothetical protein
LDTKTESVGEITGEIAVRGKRKYKDAPSKLSIKDDERQRLKAALVIAVTGRKGVDDPEMHADIIIKRCLSGLRKDLKTPWYNAPITLKGRLSVFGFDLMTMKSMEGFGANEPRRRVKENIVPREVVQPTKLDPLNIASVLSHEEYAEYERRRNAYLKHFPYLNNPADLSVLELLVRFEIMSLRRLTYILEQRTTAGMSSSVDKDIAENIKKLQETLGIAGNQRMKLMGDISSGSVAELVKRFESYVRDGKYLEVEFIWWKEEAALLLRKLDREFVDGKPELSDAVFERLMGASVALAREIVKDPYSKTLAESRKRALEIMRADKEEEQDTIPMVIDIPTIEIPEV